jgi:ketosteroid isomerase-like protein
MTGHRKHFHAIVMIVSALAMFSQAQAAPTPAELSSIWAVDWSAKNLDAVMQLYASNPVFLPTVGASWDGLSAIRKNCEGLQAKFNPHIVVHSIWNAASGELAYDSGAYDETLVPAAGGKTIYSKGNYIFIYRRRASGPWKIVEQTFTELEPIAL